MAGVSGQAVGVAAVLLIVSAGTGLYLGYSRAVAAPGSSRSEASGGAVTGSVAAKTAIPVPDSTPPAAVPDEAFIRKIAREELQAALRPKRAPARVEDTSDSSEDSSDPEPHSSAAASSSGPAAPPASAPPASIPLPQ